MNTLFSTLPNLAKELSGGSYWRMATLYATLVIFYVRVRGGGRACWPVFFQYLQKRFVLHLETLIDIDILDEVFITRRYDWDLQHPVRTIVDLGAHAGETAMYYHARYPDAVIYAVEPDPSNYARLVKNCEAISEIIPINAAVAGQDGRADFHITKSSMGNSLKTRLATEETISVETVTLSTLLDRCGQFSVDLIKFDIEGAEEELFAQASPEEFSLAYVGEFHGDLTTQTVESFQEPFAGFSVELTEPFSTPDRYMFWATK